MNYTSWCDRRKVKGEAVVHLHDEADAEIATFPQVIATDADAHSATVGSDTWRLTQTDKHLIAATLPDGTVYSADTGGKSFSRAKHIDIDLGGKAVTAVNEGGADWVYVDSADAKLGQFSGGNNGVRRSITEFEPDAGLSHDEQVFLSWVTRTALEAKLGISTLILTVSLLLIIPIVVFALL